MPVLVRNTKPGPTIFNDKLNDLVIEWQGRGDLDGEDLQQVPDKFVDNMNFLKAVRSGILEIVDGDEETMAKLDRQGVAYRERSAKVDSDALALIDTHFDQPIVTARIGEEGKDAGKVLEYMEFGTGLDANGVPTMLAESGAEVTERLKVTFDAAPLPSQV